MWMKPLMLCTFLLMLSLLLHSSVLAVLLTLESVVIMGLLVLIHHVELMFCGCYLSIGACEGAVGLACLVGLVRQSGASTSEMMS